MTEVQLPDLVSSSSEDEVVYTVNNPAKRGITLQTKINKVTVLLAVDSGATVNFLNKRDTYYYYLLLCSTLPSNCFLIILKSRYQFLINFKHKLNLNIIMLKVFVFMWWTATLAPL